MKRIWCVAALMSVVFGVTACGSDDEGDTASATLPDAETMYLEDPSDASGSTSQALCASDTYAYDVLHAFIEAYNDEISDAIALLKAVVKAEQKKLQVTGQVEYSVSGSQRSLSIVATLQSDDSVTYEATFNGPNVSDYTLLSGSANADKTAGSWDILAVDGTAVVTVTWTKTDDGDLHVVRTIAGTDRTATYDRVDTQATLVFAGTNNEASATWSTSTGDGSVTVNGEDKLCFEKTADDFCTADCAN